MDVNPGVARDGFWRGALPDGFSISTAVSGRRLALYSLIGAWMLFGLFGRDPWKPDEAYTFGIVNHIVQTGDWVVPRLAGEPFMEKPPLFFFTSATFVELLGDVLSPPDAARLATAFYVGLTLLFAGLAASTLYGRARALPCVVILIGCIASLHPPHLLFTVHPTLPASPLPLSPLPNISLPPPPVP